MKKIIIFSVMIVLLITILTSIAILKPKIRRECKIDKYNISLQIPYEYAYVENDSENTLLSLYSNVSGISISGIDLKDDFWSSGDVVARVEEYAKIISSANYDSTIKNVKTDVMTNYKDIFGKIEVELEKPDSNSKLISIITSEKIGNIVIEFFGPKENVENKRNEIEAIINSINFSKDI